MLTDIARKKSHACQSGDVGKVAEIHIVGAGAQQHFLVALAVCSVSLLQ